MKAASRPKSIAKELGQARLGDARRSTRLQNVAERLLARPGESLPRAMGSEAALEGAYRFLNSDHVDPATILAPHIAETAKRVVAAGGAYCISDTTELRFSTDREGLGPLQGNGRGFLAHIALVVAMDGSRMPLGVLNAETIVRSETLKGRRGTKKSRKADDSESLKWLRGATAAEEAVDGRVDLIHVMDREADIYALFAGLKALDARFVVRVAQNRAAEDECGVGKLFELLDSAEELVTREVPLSRRVRATKQHPRRSERMAKLSFASRTLTIRRPSSAYSALPETLTLNFVHVFEKNPPEGETPIGWKLVTSEPAETIRDIEAVVDAYRTRWVIEEFIKAVKTGCGAERSQLESCEALLNLLAIILPVAVQLLALRSLAQWRKGALASAVLSPVQIRVLRAMSTRGLSENPTAEEALLAIAALGGHLKNNGPPGWIVLSRGFQDLLRYVEAWEVLKNTAKM